MNELNAPRTIGADIHRLVIPEKSGCFGASDVADGAREKACLLDAQAARRWLGLAVGSLILAGLLALFLVVARLPILAQRVTDPGFFKRCLVVHVNLALVVWFYAYLGALYSLIPTRLPVRGLNRFGSVSAYLGVIMLLAAAGITGASPILSNYIPMIDHPLFMAGLISFGAGLCLAFFDGRLLPGGEEASSVVALPAEARPGLRAAALAFLLAMLTFISSAMTTSGELPPTARYEVLFWGGGHVLQFASVAAMVSVWLTLLSSYLGQPVMSRRTSLTLFTFLTAPLFGAPLFALAGAGSGLYRLAFMRLMQFGIVPVVSIFLFLCLRALFRARFEGRMGAGVWRDPRIAGFAASATLTVVGFTLGAMIRGSNTMVPAHYHASIGAVTASFMAMTYLLLEPLGMPMPSRRLERWCAWQPLLFGFGQAIFAVGFGLAGAHGMARKTYGAEQHIRTAAETVGLGVMGLGGFMAVGGGLLFLWIVGASWRNRTAVSAVQTRRTLWQTHPAPPIPYKS